MPIITEYFNFILQFIIKNLFGYAEITDKIFVNAEQLDTQHNNITKTHMCTKSKSGRIGFGSLDPDRSDWV